MGGGGRGDEGRAQGVVEGLAVAPERGFGFRSADQEFPDLRVETVVNFIMAVVASIAEEIER